FDDPNPVPFLTATGEFVLVLHGPDGAWVNLAMEVVTEALAHIGIGAKTNSDDYGRMIRRELYNWAPVHEETEDLETFLSEIAAASGKELSKLAHPWSVRWSKIRDEAQKTMVAKAIVGRWKQRSSVHDRVVSKEWGKAVVEAAEADQG